MKLIALLLVLWSGSLCAQLDPDSRKVTVFRDVPNSFVLVYPNTWAAVPSTHERTRIKIVSEQGSGAEDCGVNVQPAPGSEHISPERFLREFPPEMMEREFRKLPGSEILKSAKTYLANQPARLFIAEYTIRSVGLEAPMRMLMVQTFRKGKVYAVACRASPEVFEENMPIFQIILAGFAFMVK